MGTSASRATRANGSNAAIRLGLAQVRLPRCELDSQGMRLQSNRLVGDSTLPSVSSSPMHVLMHASHLFSCWYEAKRRARAFASEEIEHQALRGSLELNILAENHSQLHLMHAQMKRTQHDLHELECMLAGNEGLG
jgi:hypothetical protein